MPNLSASPSTLHGLLPGTEAAALVEPGTGWSLSYAELRETIEQLARQLAATGVEPGDGVGLVLSNGPEAVLAFLAVLRLGATAMPLNPALKAGEITGAFADKRPELLLTGDRQHDEARAACSTAGIPVRRVGRVPDMAIEGSTDDGPDTAQPEPGGIALLLHTSGTTSRPKAVPLRQSNLAASAITIAEGYSLTEKDVSYCLMPLFHVHGLVASTLATLVSGGSVVVPRRLLLSRFWDDAASFGVTWFSAVPTILSHLGDPPADGDRRLRFARSCSSALSADAWGYLEERFGVPVVEAYGMTEASHQMTSNLLPPHGRRGGTVGVATGTEVAVVDEEWRPQQAGTPGEVAVRGPGVIDAYLENPEANASSFRDGWFRTGDLGRLSEDGYLTLEGRLKELINRGGEKIAPREIDEALLSHPAVVEAVAYGIPDEKYGEIVHAAVVLSEPAEPAALAAHCGERLASFKVPREITVVEAIPKGPTGKIQRNHVASMLDR